VQKNFKLETDFEDVNWSGLSINGLKLQVLLTQKVIHS